MGEEGEGNYLDRGKEMGRVQLRVHEGKGVAESINYISGFITHNNNNPRTVV